MDDIRQRLGLAYCEAGEAQRAARGGRVHIEVSTEILEYLKSLAPFPAYTKRVTLWGYPLVEAKDAEDRHISVHTVTTIH